MSTDVVELNVIHPAEPTAVRRARRAVRDVLASAPVDDDAVAEVMLLVSELVSNAVRHAACGSFELRLSVRPERLRLEVHDDGSGFSPVVAPRRDGTGGYGLFIVQQLADRWGVECENGSSVWLEVDRPGTRHV